ncbi:MAG: PBP1A family penicillin-binding protein [Armatimonadetes bacterium]|nr:PBP1A family penicillin-binding protein [Armatimonadota bacterium]
MSSLQVLILIAISSSVGVVLAMFVNLAPALPKVHSVEAPEATIIYSSDGVILARIFREDRTNVPLKDIPKALRDATIAIEDARFYQHSGVDMRAIFRAMWENIRGHKIKQGGSTITQQLARNVYLTQRKTVERKAQEAVLAILLERNFTKDKILELYLNRVYYGSGSFGVQAAAKVYFGKDVNQLNLSECALLAGLPQKPSVYSPHENLQAALKRRNMVLKRMEELGFITPEQRIQAKKTPITIVPRARGRSTYKAPHFVDYVTSELRKRYPDDVLFCGGLRVYTTLNYEMQKIAEHALRTTIRALSKQRRVTEGCFVAIEPATGYIRAMVGSVNPASHFNRCTQGRGRQPGSAFKVFVYTAAFEEGGMRPSTRVPGGRRAYRGANGRIWSPRNYDGWYPASVSIKMAIAKSVNTAAVYTADKVGIDKVIKYAQLMGIHSELEPYLSTAIGGVKGVHPLEMASAYGTFANEGVHVEPCCVIRVTNSRGETLEDFIPEGRQVISKRTLEMMDECLRAVVTSGTGIRARDVPGARGKTGTTNDDRDAWFIGYIPGKLVAACWAGNDDYSPMRGAYGGSTCLPAWRLFMLRAIPIYDRIHRNEQESTAKKAGRRHNDVRRDDRPESVESNKPSAEPAPDATVADGMRAYRICDESQLLATPACPSTHVRTFSESNLPTSYCTIHGRLGEARRETGTEEESTRRPDREVGFPERQLTTVVVCAESGLLAGPYCPVTRKKIPVDEVPSEVCSVHKRPAR